jgi:hypothetical protein
MRNHLAQFNVGRLVAPLDSPELAEFVEMLDPVNAMAEGSPGFVWRYTTPGSNNATGDRSLGDDEIVNLSVWESREALWEFTYRTRHLDVLRKRRQFFIPHNGAYLVLWWIPAGTIPTVEEASERLLLLETNGPSAEAFTFRETYEPDGTPVSQPSLAG